MKQMRQRDIGCVPGDAPAGALRCIGGACLDKAAFSGSFPYLKAPLPGSPQRSRRVHHQHRRAP
jgi:hypothetical protein